jgi:mono/diheme cytochrome c family protein
MSCRVALVAVVCGVILASAVVYPRTQAVPRPQVPAADADGRPGPSTNAPVPQLAPQVDALVGKYCVTCHNARMRTGGLVLDEARKQAVGVHPEIWENVVTKLRTGAMPPAGLPRPDTATVATVVASLETALDRAAALRPNPGRPVVHRLNRTEYGNAIRDLLGLEVDTRALLPADNSEQGFDNIADVLSVSPALLDRYLSAARKISRLAVGRQTMADSVTYHRGRDWYQEDRMSEDLPFGSIGGIAVHHEFPVDGEYRVRLKLQTNIYDYIQGLGNVHELDVRLDGALVKRFTIGGPQHGQPPPVGYAGNIPGDARWEAYALEADADLEVRFPATTGRRVVGVSFVRRHAWEPEGVRQPLQLGNSLAQNERIDDSPGVGSLTISGPFAVAPDADPLMARELFTCRPTGVSQEEECARSILSTLARRAYRRPVTPAEVETLMTFYRTGRREDDFEAGIQHALERLLCSPEFLFRIETDPGGTPSKPYRISDLDLASRLSFFLWSSIPDDELLDLAAAGRLSDPMVLERQVRRMLADARSVALVNNFANQWLVVRNVRTVAPDEDLFPEFNENLREALQRETELFVEHVIREDRSVLDFLTADYTFLNERLARHYGIPMVYGSHFRRVSLADTSRRGLLGHGSILMVTAYPDRTSPVLRGKWLLENFLGTPPPPPPPDVDTSLKEDAVGAKPTTVRERLEQHRRNPACANCHAPMDPLGFALENFDPLGRWRTAEAGKPVDASGTLPNGTQLDGPAGLQQFLLAQREQFVTTLAEKLLMYAVGRKVDFHDGAAVRQVRRDAAAQDYRWSSLVLGIVKSVPFQMRISGS